MKDNREVMGNAQENCGKHVGKALENHGKLEGKSWENYRKSYRKSMRKVVGNHKVEGKLWDFVGNLGKN